MMEKTNLVRKDLYNYIYKEKGFSVLYSKKLIDNLLQIISFQENQYL